MFSAQRYKVMHTFTVVPNMVHLVACHSDGFTSQGLVRLVVAFHIRDMELSLPYAAILDLYWQQNSVPGIKICLLPFQKTALLRS